MDNNKSFIKETKTELKKVIWPTRQEVINGTATVIVMVAIVGIIIFALILQVVGQLVRLLNQISVLQIQILQMNIRRTLI